LPILAALFFGDKQIRGVMSWKQRAPWQKGERP
jgi:hypothetical protein